MIIKNLERWDASFQKKDEDDIFMGLFKITHIVGPDLLISFNKTWMSLLSDNKNVVHFTPQLHDPHRRRHQIQT